VIKNRESTYVARKIAFDHSLDKQDLLWETKKESWRLLMALCDRFIDKEIKANTTKANAHASRMKI
jgi:hypothetical protein